MAKSVRAHVASVTIRRDEWGIAHVRGRTDADAVFGMIYAQAEDDFPRIEANYLTALGRRAEADGAEFIWQDLRQRLFVDEAELRESYRTSPAWLRRLMNAWADGLNHYLATHPAVHPRVISRFEPWMTLAFSEGSIGGDIERGVDLVDLRKLYEPATALAVVMPGRLIEPKGSNGIALAPSRSADGHAMLWINPHTSFFFRSELQMTSDEGLDSYGAVTWGQFFIYQGFNRHAGWMHTSSGADVIDEFAETVEQKFGKLLYRYGNEMRAVTSRPVTIAYRTAGGALARRTFEVRATHHGPIIRAEGDKLVAVALMNRPRAALGQSYLRTKAHSLADYLTVSERQANSSNNTIFADDSGTVAYLHPQFVPVRNDRFDYQRPVDGSDPAADWQGLHRLATLPQAVRPKGGYVYNTNDGPWTAAGVDSPVAKAFPRYMDELGENPRGEHVMRLFDNSRRFTPAEVIAAAFDPALPFFERHIPRLAKAFAALPASDARRARLAAPVAMLSGWDRHWGVASEPTSLAVYWAEALWETEAPKASAAKIPIFRFLTERTDDATLLAAFDAGLARLIKDFGSWHVAWGRINRFQRLDNSITPRFSDAAPSLPVGFTSGNFGSLAAFGVERHPGVRCFYGTSGNSFVALVELGPKVRAWAVSAGGESGDMASPHFDDQAGRYVAGNLRPVHFDPAELTGFAAYHPDGSRSSKATAVRPAAAGKACS